MGGLLRCGAIPSGYARASCRLCLGDDIQVGERGAAARAYGGGGSVTPARCTVGVRSLAPDGAAAAPDKESDHRVNVTIAERHGVVNINVNVVAYRLSTVHHTDRVVFLDRGRVTAVGMCNEVRQSNKDVARLARRALWAPPRPIPPLARDGG